VYWRSWRHMVSILPYRAGRGLQEESGDAPVGPPSRRKDR
jgi:hypothetical protein